MTTTIYQPTQSEIEAGPRIFQAPLVRLKIIQDVQLATAQKICGPADIDGLLRERFAYADREVFVGVPMDTKNKALAVDPIATGTLNAVGITMREAFKTAMLVGAASIIFAHNHPSGVPDPSPEDRAFTTLLYRAGQLLDINVIDPYCMTSSSSLYHNATMLASQGRRKPGKERW